MPHYKHLLIATDLSETNAKLCKIGNEMASLYHAKLSIIHIVEHLPLMYASGDFALPLDPRLEEELVEEAKTQLTTLAEKYPIATENQHVIVGKRKEEIKLFVHEHQVDLVIIGTHVRHGFEHLFGTVTSGMLNKLPCDILTIKLEEQH